MKNSISVTPQQITIVRPFGQESINDRVFHIEFMPTFDDYPHAREPLGSNRK